MPVISIIVPVYNVEEYLPQCLSSILNQTHSALEVFCVNGGSTDRSAKILQEYAEKDSRIRVVDTDNRGVSHSRNLALEQITGEYCMFVDSDDWIEPQTCAYALQKMQQTEADIVMWSYTREFEGRSFPKKIFPESELLFDGEQAVLQLHRRMIGLTGEELRHPENADALCPIWGKLYRTKYVQMHRFIGLEEIGTYEDGMFNLEVFCEVKKVCFCDWHFYHYRKTNQGSLTSRYKEKLTSQWLNLFEYMRKYISSHQLGEDYVQALNNRISLSILGLGLNLLHSPMPAPARIREIGRILRNPVYQNAYETLSLRYFPIHWKLFYGCAKYRFIAGVYLLLLCVQKAIEK